MQQGVFTPKPAKEVMKNIGVGIIGLFLTILVFPLFCILYTIQGRDEK